MTQHKKVDILLSKGKIRVMAKEFRKLGTQMKAMEPALAEAVASIVAEQLFVYAEEELAAVPKDSDGLVDGNDPGDIALEGFRVSMTSPQASYIEYGTGVEGASSGYPGYKRGGYEPQATGHKLGAAWYYKNQATDEFVKTTGRPAYAPMWKAKMRIGVDLANNNSTLRKRINKLIGKEILDAFDT